MVVIGRFNVNAQVGHASLLNELYQVQPFLQALANHEDTFEHDGPNFSRPKEKSTGDQAEWKRRGDGELTAVYAAWKSLRGALALEGVWLLLTGTIVHASATKYCVLKF